VKLSANVLTNADRKRASTCGRLVKIFGGNAVIGCMDRKLLNLGCGQNRPINWINADCSLNSLLQRWPITRAFTKRFIKSVVYKSSNAAYINLNRKWKFGASAVDVVYASHVFEHLTTHPAAMFLAESYRVLKPGAVLRLVVPDLQTLAKVYVSHADRGDTTAAQKFLSAMNLHLENTMGSATRITRIIHFLQGDPHQHKYMYDSLSLSALLEKRGFVEIRLSTYGKSEYIPEINDVECTGEGIPSIYFEARKPQLSR